MYQNRDAPEQSLTPPAEPKQVVPIARKTRSLFQLGRFSRKLKPRFNPANFYYPSSLDAASIESILQEDQSDSISRRQRIYSVPTTLSLFLQQVLMKERGCKAVVTLFNKNRKEQKLREVSTNTSSYCDARARISLSLINTLVAQTASLASENLSKDQLWFGRRVSLVDGFVVNAPDTPENQMSIRNLNRRNLDLAFRKFEDARRFA